MRKQMKNGRVSHRLSINLTQSPIHSHNDSSACFDCRPFQCSALSSIHASSCPPGHPHNTTNAHHFADCAAAACVTAACVTAACVTAACVIAACVAAACVIAACVTAACVIAACVTAACLLSLVFVTVHCFSSNREQEGSSEQKDGGKGKGG